MSKQKIFSIMRNKFLILFILMLSSFYLTACGAPSAPATTGTGSSTGTGTTGATFTVGGTVSGLGSGQQLTIQNNGKDDLAISSNGAFQFATPLSDASNYNVTILTQPTSQTCAVSTNGSDIIIGSTITTVAINCNAGKLTLSIADSSGNPIINIMSGFSATVIAAANDNAGNPVKNALVTFSTDAAYGTINPLSGTALTGADGKASVILTGVGTGASTITAATQIGSDAISDSAPYSVGSPTITFGSLSFGMNSISAYGTTSVSVEVDSNGSPVTTSIPVTFNSDCVTNGKASIDTPVNTRNGIATTTYKDNGCGPATDIITASALSIQARGNLTVGAPSAGSIQFVSANPTHITLKGTGGAGLQESSTVTFKVLDSSNNPLNGKKVNFSLSTTVGGITLSQASGTTNGQGKISVAVNSGTVSTPVRVIATIYGTTIQTQSDQLTITTGIPDQDSASLSASTLNIEGWSHDGETTVLTMRLADHFNNPVPDGTAVNFRTEGGSITGSCTTTNGACSAILTSQNPRPADGRSTVLAYTIGNESFIDTNGNGLADFGEFTDTSEAFVDFNENGIRDSNEPYIDFNGNGLFDTGDGYYNGILRNPAIDPNIPKYIEVNDSIVIVFSGSNADIADNSVGGSIDLGGCNQTKSITIRVRDINKNIMPAGTTISALTTDGTLIGATSYTVANTNTKNTNSVTPIAGNPLTYLFQIESDGTFFTGTCVDSTTSGVLTITVTTPKGVITTHTINVKN